MVFTRREVLAALASTAALPLLSKCRRDAASTPPMSHDADALTLLESVADNLLRLQPETATSLGVDTGTRAILRAQLADRSEDGQRRLAAQLRTDVARINAVNTAATS